MATATTEHYRAYTPKPITRSERDTVTILFGGLHRRIERIIQGVLESSGYNAQILPVATKDDLLTGREVADIGQCCPTSFTTGNLVNFLKKEARQSSAEDVSKKFAYLTAGSCGACRFGQYHQSYELALRNSGLEMFRMFLMAQDNLDQKMGDGLDLNLPMTLGCLWGIFCTDLIQDLEYQTRPYEVRPGRAGHLPSHRQPPAPGHGRPAPREPEPVRAATAGRAVLPSQPRRRRRGHARRQVDLGLPEEEGPHDLRAVAVLLHAQHDVGRRHVGGARQVPRDPLRAAGDQGRCRGARAVALPDDPHRGQEARPEGIR